MGKMINRVKRATSPWRKGFSLAAVLGLTLVFGGCLPEPEGRNPSVLKVGIMPASKNKAEFVNQFIPLLEFLSKEMGIPYELTVPESYGDMLTRYDKREFDLALLGGFTYLKANQTHDVIPIAMRDTDYRVASYFIVKAGDQTKEISGFKGRRLGFGDRLSTSGHLIPRHFLQQQGIEPEKFFGSVRYSGSHDKTVAWVRDGDVDLGVVYAGVFKKMLKDGSLAKGEIRVLSSVPPFPSIVWAMCADVSSAFHDRVQSAFLSLSIANPAHRTILDRMNAKGFLPASKSDFVELEQIADDLGLLTEVK